MIPERETSGRLYPVCASRVDALLDCIGERYDLPGVLLDQVAHMVLQVMKVSSQCVCIKVVII